MRGGWARQPAARDRVSISCADGSGGTGALRGMPGRDASIQVHAKSRRNIARSKIVKSTLESSRCPPEGGRYINQIRVLTQTLKPVLLALAFVVMLFGTGASAQQPQ